MSFEATRNMRFRSRTLFKLTFVVAICLAVLTLYRLQSQVQRGLAAINDRSYLETTIDQLNSEEPFQRSVRDALWRHRYRIKPFGTQWPEFENGRHQFVVFSTMPRSSTSRRLNETPATVAILFRDREFVDALVFDSSTLTEDHLPNIDFSADNKRPILRIDTASGISILQSHSWDVSSSGFISKEDENAVQGDITKR